MRARACLLMITSGNGVLHGMLQAILQCSLHGMRHGAWHRRLRHEAVLCRAAEEDARHLGTAAMMVDLLSALHSGGRRAATETCQHVHRLTDNVPACIGRVHH